ncbi:MAG: NUDIX hydrolase [Patescibacteria group bacterium]|jgi:8-oxo-dGTP pyrophosphatase MutT (NUDIX family)
MLRTWKKLNSKIVYSNPWIKVHEDQVLMPNGKESIYGYLEKNQGCFVIALDNEENIYLVKQFRYALQKAILELPAGTAGDEDMLERAKAELLEETGIEAKEWKKLGGFFVAPGHESTYINVYLATDLDLSKLSTSGQDDEESILDIVKVSLPELMKMLIEGKIECGISIAALNLFFISYDK